MTRTGLPFSTFRLNAKFPVMHEKGTLIYMYCQMIKDTRSKLKTEQLFYLPLVNVWSFDCGAVRRFCWKINHNNYKITIIIIYYYLHF